MKSYPHDKYEEHRRRFPRKGAPMPQSQEVRYMTKQMFENKTPYNPMLIKKIDSKSNVYCEYVPTDGNRPTNKPVLPNVEPSSYDPRGSLPYYVVPVLYVPQKVLSDEEITPEITYQQKRTCDFFSKLLRRKKLRDPAAQWDQPREDVEIYEKRYAEQLNDEYYEYDNQESLATKDSPLPHFDCFYNVDYTISATTVEDVEEQSYDNVYQTKPTGYYKTQESYDDEGYKYPKSYKSNKSLDNTEYLPSNYYASAKQSKMPFPGGKSEHYEDFLKYAQVPKRKSKRTSAAYRAYVHNYSFPKYNLNADNRKQPLGYETSGYQPVINNVNQTYASQVKAPIKTPRKSANYESNANPIEEYDYGADINDNSYMPSQEYRVDHLYSDQPQQEQFPYGRKEMKTVGTHANFIRSKHQNIDANAEIYDRRNYVEPVESLKPQNSPKASNVESNVENSAQDLYSPTSYFKQTNAYIASKARQQTIRSEPDSSAYLRLPKPRKPFGLKSEQIYSRYENNFASHDDVDYVDQVQPSAAPQKMYPHSVASYDQDETYDYVYPGPKIRPKRSRSPTKSSFDAHSKLKRELSPLKTDAKLNTLVENPDEPNALIGEPQICEECIKNHGIHLSQAVYGSNEHEVKYAPMYPNVNGDSVDVNGIEEDAKDDSEVSDTFVECNQEPVGDKVNETSIVSPIVYTTSVKNVESEKVEQQNASTTKYSTEKELNQTYIKKSYNDMETSLEDFDEMFSIGEVPALSSLRNRTSSTKSDFKHRAPKESQTMFDDRVSGNVVTRKLATESKSTQTINYSTLRSLTASTQTERTVFDFRTPQFIYLEQIQEPNKEAPADSQRLGRQSPTKQHPVVDMKKASLKADSPKNSVASTKSSKIPEPKKKLRRIKNVS